MNSSREETTTSPSVNKTTPILLNSNDEQRVDQPQRSGSSYFAELIESLVTSSFKRSSNNDSIVNNNDNRKPGMNASTTVAPVPTTQVITGMHPQIITKRQCRHPISKKFAHPCNCGSSSSHQRLTSSNTNGTLPSSAYTLYDPAQKKCLPISRSREMLLKECRVPHSSNHTRPNNNPMCLHEDLICDSRRFRCTCKPPLHLYYEANNSSFGCVPIGLTRSPDGFVNCRQGHIYNVISRECQKIFDINELPPAYPSNVSATHFSYVTTVLIWILLLILIVTAKLRKLKSSSVYHNAPTLERRSNPSVSRQRPNSNSSAWLHPFIAAVNGHYHMNNRRATMDRHSVDEQGNLNDTDFFLANGNQRLSEILSDSNHDGISQPGFENPPPKFEEIYPSDRKATTARASPPPSNEELPTYDEAISLQRTTSPDNIKNGTG